jgi:hypothetical protein
VSDLSELSHSDRILLHLYGLMHTADAKAAKVVLLTLGFSVAAYNLGNSEFCHNRVLLAVENLVHRNAAETGHGISVPHAGQGGHGSLHKVVRVG